MNQVLTSNQLPSLQIDFSQKAVPSVQDVVQKMEEDLLDQDYFSNYTRSTNGNYDDEHKLIKLRMRAKLLAWLQKIALTSFDFSLNTLFASIEILDQYLSKTNEAPSSLQLIGTACLLIASKLYEEVSVAVQCYITALCNQYVAQDILDKEKVVMANIEVRKTNFHMNKLVGFIHRKNGLNAEHKERTETLLIELVKRQEYFQFERSNMVLTSLAVALVLENQASVETVIQYLKKA